MKMTPVFEHSVNNGNRSYGPKRIVFSSKVVKECKHPTLLFLNFPRPIEDVASV